MSALQSSGHVLGATRRNPSRSPSSITTYRDCTGMSDGKRLDSSLDILKRHYPRVASLRDYIYSILDNPTEVVLIVPDDTEEYRDLLENSKVGYHQPSCQSYRARASMFEIDEVGASCTQFPHATDKRSGHQKITMVPPSSSRFLEKYNYRRL
jgi:hypothetical protein